MLTLPHNEQRKHVFLGKMKEMSKSKKIAPRNKAALELLQYRLGYTFTGSLMAEDTVHVWQGIELRIDPDTFFT